MPRVIDPHVWKHYQEIGKRLSRIRVEQRYSQQQLADALQINRTTLAGYETGKRQMPFAVAFAVCLELNLNIRWLVENQEPRHPFIDVVENLKGVDVPQLKQRAGQEDLLTLYYDLLRNPLEEWASQQEHYEILLDKLLASRSAFTHLPLGNLVNLIQEITPYLKEDYEVHYRLKSAQIIAKASRELVIRLEGKESWKDSGQAKV